MAGSTTAKGKAATTTKSRRKVPTGVAARPDSSSGVASSAPRFRKWTPAARSSVSAYVSMLASMMALKDYDIRIEFSDSSDSSAFARVMPWPDQKRATLLLDTMFLSASPDDQRQTLVHELVHCHLFNVSAAPGPVSSHLDPVLADVLSSLVFTEVERATDALADALAPFMPFWGQ